ncbi:methyltransferase family protein [Clostridium hydrogeniformans]|uniref:methyltransferase family protein n=1 Tax=Clostridium hydrogeniformans TaxID=349933 RepID=UPI000482A181|nr:isoprenylcysteine carboxylmethyltransferase family protein [Clostridium hydrogeniformans]
MSTINKISLFLFIVFILSYTLKLIILYKSYGIKANVLGNRGKDANIFLAEFSLKISTFLWGALWFIQSLNLNINNNFFKFVYINLNIRYLGIGLNFIGLLIFIIAMVNMGLSWRVGIDKKSESKLVTKGIYNFSRNPAFVGFDLMFLGLFLTFPNIITLVIILINIIFIHRLILQEEKHLISIFGDDYYTYTNKTPRYIIFK